MDQHNITWILQTTGINNAKVIEQYEVLKGLGHTAVDVGIIPFTNTITNLENILQPNTTFIIKGGIKILTILDTISNISEVNEFLSNEQILQSDYYIKQLNKAIDYDIIKFDQEHYTQFNLPLLNNQAEYKPFSEIKNIKFDKPMFIKPSRDLKAFNGGIIPQDTTIEEFVLNNYPQTFYKDENIVISKVVDIYAEYRFFIIGEEVITGSLYKRGGNLVSDSNIPQYIMLVAKEYAKLYNPAEIFVMDLAETQNGISIIEYNCWNASGLYSCDAQKLFHEITEYKKYN